MAPMMKSVSLASSGSNDGSDYPAVEPRVLLVDRQPAEVAMTIDQLADAGLKPSVVDDCHAALRIVADERPSVVIVGNLSRYVLRSDFCRLLRETAPCGPTILLVLLPPDAERTRIRCLEQGADGFIASLADTDAILAKIRLLTSRMPRILPRRILAYGLVEMDLDQIKVYAGGIKLSLSPNAFRLLRAFLEHPDGTLSRQDLLTALGIGGSAKPRTADSYVKALRAALASAGVDSLVTTVPHLGYRLASEAGIRASTPGRVSAENRENAATSTRYG